MTITTAEKIKIMQAFLDGEVVECWNLRDKWPVWGVLPPSAEPQWSWTDFKYRIQLKKYWINIYKAPYPTYFIGRPHTTREEADRATSVEVRNTNHTRVACLSFREGDGL